MSDFLKKPTAPSMILLIARVLLPFWILSDLVYIGKEVLPVLVLTGRIMLRTIIPGEHDVQWIACFQEQLGWLCEDQAYYMIGDDWLEYVDDYGGRPQPTVVQMRWLYWVFILCRLLLWICVVLCVWGFYLVCTRAKTRKSHKKRKLV